MREKYAHTFIPPHSDRASGLDKRNLLMAVNNAYRAFILEQLEPFAHVTARAMFGGVGLYADGLFFALIADNTLYFKVDDTNRPDFEAAGMEPFRPYDDDRAMHYYQVPAEVIEDPEHLQRWMLKAVDVARSKKKKKR